MSLHLTHMISSSYKPSWYGIIWLLVSWHGMAAVNLVGIYGKNIDFPCHSFKSSIEKINRVYFQKLIGETPKFLNGYIKKENNTVDVQRFIFEKYKNRTYMDIQNNVITLKNVTIEDTGDYECILINSSNEDKIQFHLSIIANLTRPEISVNKDNPFSCNATYTCSASGIYPKPEIRWHFTPNISSTEWMVIDNNSSIDPQSGLYNVSSMIAILSKRDINISCSIHDDVSLETEVCQKHSPERADIMWIIASAIIVALVILILFILFVKKKNMLASASTSYQTDTTQEMITRQDASIDIENPEHQHSSLGMMSAHQKTSKSSYCTDFQHQNEEGKMFLTTSVM
ncbi:T-lymphocyte activation antigen CD80 [Erpetoichthys calabaricus]|uniref:T-lymphocyte activation antigen CD80-like n=1 Tax=Erpetoichthys calabaricus TaxID=27687 RepID=A0A8C4RP33_ERPCA|nr:T-lymphocyte activation antigen CD80 [Erpetoichthys calabaricus]